MIIDRQIYYYYPKTTNNSKFERRNLPNENLDQEKHLNHILGGGWVRIWQNVDQNKASAYIFWFLQKIKCVLKKIAELSNQKIYFKNWFPTSLFDQIIHMTSYK